MLVEIIFLRIKRREIFMKKIIPLSFGFLALSLGTLAGFKHTHFEVAKAYDKASLPTTIDLNKVEDTNVRSYYSGLNSLSDSEKTGTNLLKNLKPILKNGQKYYSYESKAAIWQMYEIIDRDWEKSPASSIPVKYGSYNSETNIISNYVYGKNNSDKGSDPYVHALYINRDVENETKAWGNHNQDQWGINQEHIWPKSHGFEESGDGGARGDPMHLWAGNGYSNNVHRNYFYGNVDTTKTYTDCGTKYSNQTGNLLGVSKTTGSGTVFEPQDCDKGDIARAVFYMVARYNYLSGSDSDGIDANNPNLELVQSSNAPSEGYQSTTTTTGKLGIISDLLEWNKLDPVDEFEIRRNDLLFRNYTNNRNPFIDFPQWADLIWGEDKGSKSANPASDSINDSVIVLKDFESTIQPGETHKFSATVEGGANIEWTIADETIAVIGKANSEDFAKTVTVASGEEVVIKALKDGTTKLTAKTTVGGEQYEKSYTIKVGAKSANNGGESIIDKIINNKTYLIIAIAVIVVVIILVILFLALASKKTKKKVGKTIKKSVKKSIKGSKGNK